VQSTLPSLERFIGGQRLLLITSVNGAKRRSAGLVQHVLRTRLNCNVQTAVITEASVSGARDAIDLARRTQASAVVGLGGSAVLDLAKFVAYESGGSKTHIVTIPCVPSGGKELFGHAELFDWDKEERVVMVNDKPSLSCLLDPQLALDDRISAETDCRAFASSLALFLNQPDTELVKNQALLDAIQKAIEEVVSPNTASKAQFSVDSRRALFRPGDFGVGEQVTRECSLDIVVANTITAKVAIPRSLVRNSLLYSSTAARCRSSEEFSRIVQHMAATSKTEAALGVLSKVLQRAGTPKNGLSGLLTQFLDAKAVEVLYGHIVDWVTEASNAPEYAALELDVSRLKYEVFVRGW